MVLFSARQEYHKSILCIRGCQCQSRLNRCYSFYEVFLRLFGTMLLCDNCGVSVNPRHFWNIISCTVATWIDLNFNVGLFYTRSISFEYEYEWIMGHTLLLLLLILRNFKAFWFENSQAVSFCTIPSCFSPLWLRFFSKERVEDLLDAGCSSNCIDSERARNTPLHWASSYGTADITQLLIGTVFCLTIAHYYFHIVHDVVLQLAYM